MPLPQQLLSEIRTNNINTAHLEFDKLKSNPELVRYGGSLSTEGNSILTYYLEKFIAQKPYEGENLKKLTKIFKYFKAINENKKLTIPEQIKRLEDEKNLWLTTGYRGHAIGASLIKNAPGSYTLHLVDREKCNTDPKTKIVQSIPLAEQHLAWILKCLEQAQFMSEKSANDLFFQKIPSVLEASWQFNQNLLQAPYKADICFYANQKSLLLDGFSTEFGEEKGYQLYKEFTLFLRKAILLDYKKHQNNDSYEKLC